MHIAITGASSGIGAAIAREFGQSGHQLSVAARRVELLDALAAELPCETATFQVDLDDLDDAVRWVDGAVARFGPIDVLVNNAGIQYVEHALGVSDERAEKLFRVNVLAPMRITRRVGAAMVERGHGTIVNIASMAAITPTPGMGHYNASKAALAAFSESLRVELEGTGVHVITVYPGPVHSPMEGAARDKFEDSAVVNRVPTGDAGELARLIRRAVQKGHARLSYPRVYGLARYFRVTSQWVTDTFAPQLRGEDGS
jgi:short-subunit dehydrogenase